jgi:hypothetical protein
MDRGIAPLYLDEVENLAIRSTQYGHRTVREVWVWILDNGVHVSERRTRKVLDGLCDQGVLERSDRRPYRYKLATTEFELAKRVIHGLWFGAMATHSGEHALQKAVKYHADNFI